MKRLASVGTPRVGTEILPVLTAFLLVTSLVTPFVGVAAASGGIRISVEDASGSSVSGAKVVLYDSNWNVEGSENTNRFGRVTFSGQTAGEYRYEVYHDGAFWGGDTTTIDDGSTTYEQFSRTEPYRSGLSLTDKTDGDGTYYVGDTINVAPRVRNDVSYDRNVRVEILVDTDDDGTAERTRTRGPLTVDGNSESWYGYDYTPESDGTKRVRVKVETDIGGGYTLTDDTGWTESFEVRTTAGRVEGRVTDDSGDPISNAKVYVDSRNDVRTDSDGRYAHSSVETGQHSVYVTAGACYETKETTVNVDTGETVSQNFRLSPTRHSVALDSEPVSVSLDGAGTYDCGSDVSVSAPRTEDEYEFDAWKTRDGDVVSRDASFTLDYVTSDATLVAHYEQAGKPDLRIRDVTPSPSSPEEGDAVSFDVSVANGGEVRAADTDLELSIDGNVYRRENFDLGAGDRTTITLTDAWTALADPGTVRAEIDYRDQIDEADESNNEYAESIAVGSGVGTVRGRVTDPDGEGIDGAKVYLDDSTDTRTGDDGNYEFTDVAVGSHDLEVVSADYETTAASVAVSKDETTTKNFQLGSATETYTLRIDVPESGGTVGVEPPGESYRDTVSRTYEAGTAVTITARADSGYEFGNWTGDYPTESRTNRSVTVTMDDNVTLQPRFSQLPAENRISWVTAPPEQVQPGEPITATVSGYAEADGKVCLRTYPSRGRDVTYRMDERCREVSTGEFEFTYELSSPKEALRLDEPNFAIERVNNVRFVGELSVTSGTLGGFENAKTTEWNVQVTQPPVEPSSFPYEETTSVVLPSASPDYREWKWMNVRVDREKLPEPNAYRVSVTVKNVGRDAGGIYYFEDLDGHPNSQMLLLADERTASVTRVNSTVNGQTKLAETKAEFDRATAPLRIASDIATGGLKVAAKKMAKELIKGYAEDVAFDFLEANTELGSDSSWNVPAEWEESDRSDDVRVLRADFDTNEETLGLFPTTISEVDSYTLTVDVKATNPSGSTLVVVPDMRGKFVHQDSGAGASEQYRYVTEYRRQISVPIPVDDTSEITDTRTTETTEISTEPATETRTRTPSEATTETTGADAPTPTPTDARSESAESTSVIDTISTAIGDVADTVKDLF